VFANEQRHTRLAAAARSMCKCAEKCGMAGIVQAKTIGRALESG
jgi:hypothetical protein